MTKKKKTKITKNTANLLSSRPPDRLLFWDGPPKFNTSSWSNPTTSLPFSFLSPSHFFAQVAVFLCEIIPSSNIIIISIIPPPPLNNHHALNLLESKHADCVIRVLFLFFFLITTCFHCHLVHSLSRRGRLALHLLSLTNLSASQRTTLYRVFLHGSAHYVCCCRFDSLDQLIE